MTTDNPWKERHGGGHSRPGKTARDDWQRDRARIIHSAAFRRLQSKTQVLGLGESDFYRTRLTHSLEVAQIGSGIVSFLRGNTPVEDPVTEWLPSSELIEAICMSHDLGHPPFGHGGEISLNYCMRNDGGFEGNGQTLRILTTLGEYSLESGLDLTRRTLLGVLKYPALFEDVQRYPSEMLAGVGDLLSLDFEAWRPPKCCFAEERAVLDWLFQPFSVADREHFTRTAPSPKSKFGHHRTRYKALDTSLMELADDIAYGIHDLEDAVVLRLVDRDLWQAEIVEPLKALGRSPLGARIDAIGRDLFTPRSFFRKNAIGELVHYFVESVEVVEREEFAHPLLRYNARFNPMAEQELDFFVRFISKNVIHRPELQMLVYKGQLMIARLFTVLSANPDKLLPGNIRAKWEESSHKARVISDFIAGMTDNYAERMYSRLFLPREGSVFDRI